LLSRKKLLCHEYPGLPEVIRRKIQREQSRRQRLGCDPFTAISLSKPANKRNAATGADSGFVVSLSLATEHDPVVKNQRCRISFPMKTNRRGLGFSYTGENPLMVCFVISGRYPVTILARGGLSHS
jgi:hypothetical protein